MAEIFASVSAGIGVAAAAGQLIDGIRKLSAFCSEIRNIPEDIQNAVEDLEDLVEVLEGVQLELERSSTLPTGIRPDIWRRLLECLERGSQDISATLAEMRRMVEKRRTWGRVKAVGMKRRLEKSAKRIQNAQMHLLVAFATDNRALVRHGLDANQQGFTAVFQSLECIRTSSQPDSQLVSSAVHVPGNSSRPITASSEEARMAEDNVEEVSFSETAQRRTRLPADRIRRWRLQFPTWFLTRAWDLSFSQATSGWDVSLRAYRIVCPHSEFFKACRTGDLSRIQRLLTSGKASVWDCDDSGTTALHLTASSWMNSSSAGAIFRFLLHNGADINAVTDSGLTVSECLSKERGEWRGSMNRDGLAEIYRALICHPDWDCGDVIQIKKPGDDLDLHFNPPPAALRLVLNQVFPPWATYSTPLRIRLFISQVCFYGAMTESIQSCIGDEPFVPAYAQCDAEDQRRVIVRMVCSLAIENKLPGDIRAQEARRILREMFDAGYASHLVALGDDNETTMQVYVSFFSFSTLKPLNNSNALRQGIKMYLAEMQSVGFDLASLGKAMLKHLRSLTPGSRGRRLRTRSACSNAKDCSNKTDIVGLDFGPQIEDWHLWLSNPLDEWAGDFWDMTDHPERAVPGAWADGYGDS